jgi:hypothetical protein
MSGPECVGRMDLIGVVMVGAAAASYFRRALFGYSARK